MKLNQKPARISKEKVIKAVTHQGGVAANLDKQQELRRSVLACMLWEDTFYEKGEKIADRIERLATEVSPMFVANLAVEARTQMNLRHVPLLLLCAMAKTSSGTNLLSSTIEKVIQRPDELTELLAIYWRNGKTPISKQMKLGLALAFRKFNEYQLAKYNRDGPIKLRDVLFLCHAKPVNEEQGFLWQKLINGTLETPDTWETNLSAGADKKETFERLLREDKLGYLALLRNLRNMEQSGVDRSLVNNALMRFDRAGRILPFRYIAAYRHSATYRGAITAAFDNAVQNQPRMKGKTAILVDLSGSMHGVPVSKRSDMDRMDAAIALALAANCDEKVIYTFADSCRKWTGGQMLSDCDGIRKSNGGGTDITKAVRHVNEREQYDRVIVITDEQSNSRVPVPLPKTRGYMINVGSYNPSVAYGDWVSLTGFSENIFSYISELEKYT